MVHLEKRLAMKEYKVMETEAGLEVRTEMNFQSLLAISYVVIKRKLKRPRIRSPENEKIYSVKTH
jgi:hypothetical protein